MITSIINILSVQGYNCKWRLSLKLLKCIVYLAIIGVFFFLMGRLFQGVKHNYTKLPYKSFDAEKDGQVYEHLGIRIWKDKIPDMSKIFKNIMEPKKINIGVDEEQVEQMIQETCTAELTHVILIVMGIGCVFIWPGLGGVLIAIVYAIGNLPYIFTQRYNRPKLIRVKNLMTDKNIKGVKI